MLEKDLERKIEAIRAKPLKLLCKTPRGTEEIMSVRDCVRSGSRYICIIANELDTLLDDNLGKRRVPYN